MSARIRIWKGLQGWHWTCDRCGIFHTAPSHAATIRFADRRNGQCPTLRRPTRPGDQWPITRRPPR